MNIFDLVFLIIPIAAISANKLFGWKRSLWLIFILWVLIGWMLRATSVWWFFEQLDQKIRSMPNPPEELMRAWEHDGAARVVALYFGWAIAAIYFLACLVVVNVVRDVRDAFRKKK